MTGLAEQIVAALRTHRLRYGTEVELHDSVEALLRHHGLPVRREVRLSPRDRIDLLVGRVGIEAKVAGQTDSLERQLARYAQSSRIEALVVVSRRPRHLHLPAAINGRPVHAVALAGR